MFPKIWSTTDRTFCYFGPFFCPFTPLKHQKIKISKEIKKPLKIYHHFTQVHQQS